MESSSVVAENCENPLKCKFQGFGFALKKKIFVMQINVRLWLITFYVPKV